MSVHPSSSCPSSRRASRLLGVCASLGVAFPALAANGIGSVAGLSQSVTGAVSGTHFVPVSYGDEVKQNETVRTDASGEARLTLVDYTDLTIFRRSSIRLDQFILENPNRARSVVMSTSDGHLRLQFRAVARGLPDQHFGGHAHAARDEVHLHCSRREPQARCGRGRSEVLPARQEPGLLRRGDPRPSRARKGRRSGASPGDGRYADGSGAAGQHRRPRPPAQWRGQRTVLSGGRMRSVPAARLIGARVPSSRHTMAVGGTTRPAGGSAGTMVRHTGLASDLDTRQECRASAALCLGRPGFRELDGSRTR